MALAIFKTADILVEFFPVWSKSSSWISITQAVINQEECVLPMQKCCLQGITNWRRWDLKSLSNNVIRKTYLERIRKAFPIRLCAGGGGCRSAFSCIISLVPSANIMELIFLNWVVSALEPFLFSFILCIFFGEIGSCCQRKGGASQP